MLQFKEMALNAIEDRKQGAQKRDCMINLRRSVAVTNATQEVVECQR
jgi:hypothetical protein